MTLPSIRILAWGAGALLAICAGAAVAAMYLAFSSNDLARQSLPAIATNFRIVGVLGAVQILCCLLIWRFFIFSRRRFTQRLQAATGGMNDRIFLADASGTPRAMLARGGWIARPAQDWLSSIHPEDRLHWPVRGAGEPQRIEVRLNEGNEWRWHRLRATPIVDSSGHVREWVGTLHDIHEQKLANEHRDLVIEELRHRLKNLVTVIDALAKNSRRSKTVEPGVESYLQRFLGRLHALGAAGDLVLAGNRISVETGALVKATLAPFMSENVQRIHLGGPRLLLSEELAAGLGLAVHELATNALKYGALSVPEGKVSLVWSVAPAGEAESIIFDWKETGGPAPAAPAKPGFGTNVIKHVVVREKSGRVDIEYPPEGLTCQIAFLREEAKVRA